jgi:two-component system, LytTR family, sensor kinase
MPTNNNIRPGLHRWFWIASIWFGFALFGALQTVFVMRSEGMHHAWLKLFVTTLLSWLPWALVTPLILRLGHKYPPVTLKPFRIWLAHIAAWLTVGMVFSTWAAEIEVLFNPYAYPSLPSYSQLWSEKLYNGVLSSIVLYAAVLTVSYVLDSRERLAFQRTETARLNEQLSKAQLSALRQQIEPHFLFNTLNAVSGLVREGRNDSAVSMIAGLSDFLRRILDDSSRQEVLLQEEMDFALNYLDIQKVRFADRLQLSVDVPDELYPAKVPSLILQPMVENAIKHGIAKRAQGGSIRISASGCDGMLTLRVSNDGPSLPADWDATRSGIGISNVRTRLQSLYGNSFELSMRNRMVGGVEVSVTLPLVVVPASTEA